MNLKNVLGLVTASIALLSPSLPAQEHPNILLILSDDHSVPHVGVYGGPNCQKLGITPNLDRLAEEGMRFDRAYTASPQCAPSRISIFAGRSPVKLGVTRFSQPAAGDAPLFTDTLREHGYWVGIGGRHHHLDGRMADPDFLVEALQEGGFKGHHEERFDQFLIQKTKGGSLAEVPNYISGALDQVPEGKPFFFYFGFNQPHRRFGEDHEGIDPAELVLPADWPDLPEVRLDYARYLDDVRELDDGVGMIDEILEQRGLKENTLVIFMGDNGEAHYRGKGTLNGRGIHVPLIIRWPGQVEAGSVSQSLISGIDLAPTILAAAGLDAPDEFDGLSFLPELQGNEFEGNEFVFSERGWHWGPITRSDGLDLSRSVTAEQFHLIYNVLPDRLYTPVDMSGRPSYEAVKAAHAAGELSALHEELLFRQPRPMFELYDLKADPLELQNLADDPESALMKEQLMQRLAAWMVREQDFLPLPTDAAKTSGVK